MTEYAARDDASTSESLSKVQTALAALRAWQDSPNDEALNKRVQQQCLDYLLAQGDSHWFCKQHRSKDQEPEREEALDQVALFCVRLVGYKPAGKVLQWRQHLEKLLLECHGCVEGWVEAQNRVGEAYLLKRWNRDHVANWYTSLHNKEQERVNQALSSVTDTVPSCLVHNILLDHALYSQHSILDSLSEHLAQSQTRIPLLKGIAVPPGLLALLVSEDARLRDWARQCAASMAAMSLEDVERKDARHLRVITTMLETVATRDRLLASDGALPAQGTVDDVPASIVQKDYWKGLLSLVNLLSSDILQQHFGGGGRSTDIVRLVSGHLGDKDEHWVYVLEVFKCLLTTLGDLTWKNLLDRKGKGKAVEAGDDSSVGDVGYAGARLYDALDNPHFFDTLSSMFQGGLPSDAVQTLDLALFGWLYPFLRSLRSTTYFAPCFTSILARLIDNYGLQTRFASPIRARCIRAALQLCCDIFPRSTAIVGKTSWPYLSDSIKDVERHCKTIVEVAFDRAYALDDSWKEARQVARRLTAVLCKRDALNIRDYIYGLIDKRKRLLSSGAESTDNHVTPLQVCEELYKQSADAFAMSFSSTGLAGFAEGLACTAHLAKLNKRAWLQEKKHEESLRACMIKANQAIDHLYGPIARMLTTLAGEDPNVIKKTLKLDGVVENLVTLILSPTEKVAMAAQSVVRQAFDASSRVECFKALFTDFPEQALRGILVSLRTFKESASRLPEACDQAKRLVRCLTDVVNVLCDPTQPMIRDAHWVEKHNAQSNISKIWNLMCYDIALIFDRTVKWSVMFENDEMTDWVSSL
jgi:senataxin